MKPRMSRLMLLALLGAVWADPEYVRKKICKEVEQNQCTVYTAVVDPCLQGPYFCAMKRNKKYGLTLNLTPHFSAEKLKLSINGDVMNDDKYSTIVLPPKDGCGVLTCPLQAEERRIFDVDLVFDKRASGKFSVKVKLWNEANSTQVCCFTFSVKVK